MFGYWNTRVLRNEEFTHNRTGTSLPGLCTCKYTALVSESLFRMEGPGSPVYSVFVKDNTILSHVACLSAVFPGTEYIEYGLLVHIDGLAMNQVCIAIQFREIAALELRVRNAG